MVHLKSIEEFEKLIKEDKVLVDFYADWCGPCQMLTPVIEKVEKERKNVKVVKVNTDEFLELAQEYKVMAIPALKIFEKGKLTKENVGFLDYNELIDFIDK